MAPFTIKKKIDTQVSKTENLKLDAISNIHFKTWLSTYRKTGASLPYRRAGDNSVLNNLPHQQSSPESQVNDAKESTSSKIALLRRTSGFRAAAVPGRELGFLRLEFPGFANLDVDRLRSP